MYSAIQAKYPDHKFIGEESWAAGQQADVTDAPTWIIDPIDGTTNFVKGFPFVCISIGFVYQSEPTIGVIYAPFLGYLYAGRKGHGAFVTTPLHPQRRALPLVKPPPLPSFKQALIAFEWGSDRSLEVMQKKSRSYQRLVGDSAAGVEGGQMALGVRSMGSAALNFAHVAMGCLDAYWEIGCWAWDVCAGIVIAREAYVFIVDKAAAVSLWDPRRMLTRLLRMGRSLLRRPPTCLPVASTWWCVPWATRAANRVRRRKSASSRPTMALSKSGTHRT